MYIFLHLHLDSLTLFWSEWNRSLSWSVCASTFNIYAYIRPTLWCWAGTETWTIPLFFHVEEQQSWLRNNSVSNYHESQFITKSFSLKRKDFTAKNFQDRSKSITIFPLKKFNDGFNQQIPDFRHFAKTEGMHVNECTPWENFSVEINDHQT